MQAAATVDWLPAPAIPVLEPDQIHVWRLELPDVAPSPGDWLSEAEHRRLSAFTDDNTRRDYLALRHLLRRTLAPYVGQAAEALHLETRDGGKPALRGGPEFNLSHTHGLILLAVATQPVGIDVERVRPVPRRVAITRRVLGERQAVEIEALPVKMQDVAFLHAWTAMEARQKCHGEGVFGRRILVEDVGRYAFVPAPDMLASLAWMHPDSLPQILFYQGTS